MCPGIIPSRRPLPELPTRLSSNRASPFKPRGPPSFPDALPAWPLQCFRRRVFHVRAQNRSAFGFGQLAVGLFGNRALGCPTGPSAQSRPNSRNREQSTKGPVHPPTGGLGGKCFAHL